MPGELSGEGLWFRFLDLEYLVALASIVLLALWLLLASFCAFRVADYG